jgi:hypothetical protein
MWSFLDPLHVLWFVSIHSLEILCSPSLQCHVVMLFFCVHVLSEVGLTLSLPSSSSPVKIETAKKMNLLCPRLTFPKTHLFFSSRSTSKVYFVFPYDALWLAIHRRVQISFDCQVYAAALYEILSVFSLDSTGNWPATRCVPRKDHGTHRGRQNCHRGSRSSKQAKSH